MKYTAIDVNGITIFIARIRRARHFNLSIHNDGCVYATYPWYSSKRELIEYLSSKTSWIIKMKQKVEEKVALHEERFTKEELKRLIDIYINKYVPLFREKGYCFSVDKVSMRKMTTRFGSCTPSNRTIRFSTELSKCTDEFIEYVVVHELAHLTEANHSKKFWEIVKSFIPDYKRIDKF